MNTFKKDFPIFKNNPDLIFLDSSATSQKPDTVIDWLKKYLENNYSNIHRWMYDIAINSEKLYFDSKKKVASFLNAENFTEIIYTYNANYALNLITQTLRYNNFLKKWDKVLLSIVEHHSNIVPWQILKKEIWIEIDFVNIDKNFDLDINDFKKKYDDKVKIVSLTQVSNVTGQIFDLEKIKNLLKKDTLFIIDASQSFPHFKVDVIKLWADFVFFTWHKVMADTWIWIIRWKKELLEKFDSIFSWWWAINEVKKYGFKYWALPYKFEPWTPNISWAVSLLKALEYIESIWWYEKIKQFEDEITKYTLNEFKKRNYITLVWGDNLEKRIWVFSFFINWVNPIDIADIMAENNICIRAWQHCAEPFMDFIWHKGLSRISLYIYNTKDDIDKFFEILDKNFT